MYRGKIIGEYTYDVWGNCEVIELSIDSETEAGERDKFVLYNNPFRYKGYYCDIETGLYYCDSRYYHPTWGRFIQPADVSSLNPQSVNGLNLYIYALNNTIKYGKFSGRIVNTLSSNIGINTGFSQGNILSNGTPFMLGLYGGINSMFNLADAVMSYGGGVLDGLLSLLGSPGFDKFQSKLSRESKWMAGIGLGLDILSSAINNYNNDSLTTGQKWASFGADAGYYIAKAGLSYAAGSLVTSGAVALGTAAGCAAITYLGVGFLGASLIAGGIVGIAIIAGTTLIIVLSNALDNWWEKKKEEWFN